MKGELYWTKKHAQPRCIGFSGKRRAAQDLPPTVAFTTRLEPDGTRSWFAEAYEFPLRGLPKMLWVPLTDKDIQDLLCWLQDARRTEPTAEALRVIAERKKAQKGRTNAGKNFP